MSVLHDDPNPYGVVPCRPRTERRWPLVLLLLAAAVGLVSLYLFDERARRLIDALGDGLSAIVRS